MANSVVTVSVLADWHDGKRQHVVGSIAIAAGDYPAGGFTVPWVSDFKIKSDRNPTIVIATGKAGYAYVWDRANQKLRIFQSAGSAAPMVEVATTTPSGVVSDIIDFYAIFRALL